MAVRRWVWFLRSFDQVLHPFHVQANMTSKVSIQEAALKSYLASSVSKLHPMKDLPSDLIGPKPVRLRSSLTVLNCQRMLTTHIVASMPVCIVRLRRRV